MVLRVGLEGVYSVGDCCIAPDIVGKVGAVLAFIGTGRPTDSPPGCKTLGTDELLLLPPWYWGAAPCDEGWSGLM